jgi:hypothetical protein
MYEILGVLLLGALWVEAVLVAAAAWLQIRGLRSIRARLHLIEGAMGVGMIEGEIERCIAGDVFATHTIEQVGRALDAKTRTIAFHDRANSSKVFGGAVRTREGPIQVPENDGRASVWTSRIARLQTAARFSPDVFDAAYAEACSQRGYIRTLNTSLRVGDHVFVSGELVQKDDRLVIQSPRGGDLLIAAEDPRRIVAEQSRVALAFIVVELLLCALCTRIALWPPLFDRVSTIGGALCLGFFLGVTPVGVYVRDRCAPPSQSLVNGRWRL